MLLKAVLHGGKACHGLVSGDKEPRILVSKESRPNLVRSYHNQSIIDPVKHCCGKGNSFHNFKEGCNWLSSQELDHKRAQKMLIFAWVRASPRRLAGLRVYRNF